MLPLSKPNINSEDVDLVKKVILSGQLVQGEKVIALEEEFSRLHDLPFAIAVSNGTAALHLALLALGVGPGDEVLVTAYSFVASANAIVLAGAKPVFCDTALDSYNMNHEILSGLITGQTKAIIVVHEFGMPARVEEIMAFAKIHDLPVIEDAACALGSIVAGKRLGTFGEISCFSFHPRKLITCGEGGMILTSNKGIDSFLRSMRNHGLDSGSESRTYSRAGFNYRLSDISAALLLPQLSRLPEIVSRRNQIANRYLHEITNSQISLPVVNGSYTYNWQTFPIRLNDLTQRNAFIEYAHAKGVSALKPAQFIPSEPFYSSMGVDVDVYPNAKALQDEAVALPMFELMNEEDVNLVIEVCNEF
jgi:perosamine synthetase